MFIQEYEQTVHRGKNGKPTQLKVLNSNLNPRQSMTPMTLILSRIYSSTLPFSLSLHFMSGHPGLPLTPACQLNIHNRLHPKSQTPLLPLHRDRESQTLPRPRGSILLPSSFLLLLLSCFHLCKSAKG